MCMVKKRLLKILCLSNGSIKINSTDYNSISSKISISMHAYYRIEYMFGTIPQKNDQFKYSGLNLVVACRQGCYV